MISPDEIFAQYQSALGLHHVLKLRRGTDPATDVEVRGRIFALNDDQLDGGAQQFIRKAIILARDTSGTPLSLPIAGNKDRLVVGDKVLTIKSADTLTRRIAGHVVAIELMVAGG